MAEHAAGRWGWLAQALSGIVLIVLLGFHWVAQHLVAAGGLRSYADVVNYLRQPAVFALEVTFLVVVTTHALLGVRAVVLDLGPKPRLVRLLNAGLLLLGLATVVYGINLAVTMIR
jgi:succinate dehydrogenase / fumarate reductase, membrane anchor subunit